jgi:hypothetical protein
MTDNNKIPIPLNLPKDKDVQFDDVSFVNNMTEYSLKVFIKRIWQQLMALANTLEPKHKDLPVVLDRIMSGQKWTKNDIHDRYQFGMYNDVVIQYDTLERVFTLMDETRTPIHPPIHAVSISEAKAFEKKNKE